MVTQALPVQPSTCARPPSKACIAVLIVLRMHTPARLPRAR